MNIKLSPTSDLQFRFWRWMVDVTGFAMNYRPIIQRALFTLMLLLAGLAAFTLGRLAGEFIASWFI